MTWSSLLTGLDRCGRRLESFLSMYTLSACKHLCRRAFHGPGAVNPALCRLGLDLALFDWAYFKLHRGAFLLYI